MGRDLLAAVMMAVNLCALAYFIALSLIYLVTSVLAFAAMRQYARQLKMFSDEQLLNLGGLPPITVLSPAYNEEAGCVESVHSLLTIRYPELEILIVNDGSKDRTLEKLTAEFQLTQTVRLPTANLPCAPVQRVFQSELYPNLWVIDKQNGGGKADALNAGLNYCRTPLFCATDADSLIERDAFLRVVRPFLEDKRTIAVGGIVRIVNNCSVVKGQVQRIRLPRTLVGKLQVLEYLRAFLAGRMGWSVLNTLLIVSGAFGVFRRTTVVDVGGFNSDAVGEDIDLVVRMHRLCRERKQPYRIAFVPDPMVWTEAPETLRDLGKQRDRWQRGLIETLWRYRAMLFNWRYGRIGLVGMPFYLIFEMFGPILEAAGYITFAASLWLGIVAPSLAVAFLTIALLVGVGLSLAAVTLQELSCRRFPRMLDLLALSVLALIENFGYRQLSVWWRLRGTVSILMGRKGWGSMSRQGFNSPADAEQGAKS